MEELINTNIDNNDNDGDNDKYIKIKKNKNFNNSDNDSLIIQNGSQILIKHKRLSNTCEWSDTLIIVYYWWKWKI